MASMMPLLRRTVLPEKGHDLLVAGAPRDLERRPQGVRPHAPDPQVGFIVTNLTRPVERVVRFYNGRGTAEQWIREGKQALHWTRLSCCAFRDNAVRLQLFALACNLANFLRSLALPDQVAQWTL